MATIMIVDDDAGLLQSLTIRLRAAGFKVLAAAHPDAALSTILREQPDLLLLDINMPHFSGLDFHQCLRVTERGRDIPIIYLSGQRTPAHIEDAYRQGARAFIVKPYDAHELLATIKGILESRVAATPAAPKAGQFCPSAQQTTIPT